MATDISTPRQLSRRQAVATGLVILGVTPFFVQHLLNLWRYRPHYEFFPLVLVAFAYLAWRRWPSRAVHTSASRWTARFVLLLGFAVLAASVVLFSPWLGAIAAVICVGGVLLLLLGWPAIGRLLTVWLLLWLVIPPPWRLDDELIRLLQSLTARTGSMLLEMVKVDHLLAGNVFRLPGRELFVAEACSGVNSQFVLIAVSLLLLVVLRRAWLHAILLVASSVFWSAVVNTVRVNLIVVAAVQWDMDLSDGWRHQVLGHTLVLIGFLLLLSTDRLLAGLLAPVLDFRRAAADPDSDGMPLAADPLSRLWNRVVAVVSRAAPGTPDRVEGHVPAVASGRGMLLAAGPFGCLGVLQLFLLMSPQTPEIHVEGLATEFEETWLPSRAGNWQRVEYRTEERELSSDEGEFSHFWVYQSGDRLANVSVDFPFLGWHEVTRCYKARGWLVERRTVRRDSAEGPFIEVQLSKPNGETGYLLFSLFDGDARPVEPKSTHWTGLRGKLARSPLLALIGQGDRTISQTQTTLQIQQFIGGNHPLDESQRQMADEVYVEFRHRLLERWQADAIGE